MGCLEGRTKWFNEGIVVVVARKGDIVVQV